MIVTESALCHSGFLAETVRCMVIPRGAPDLSGCRFSKVVCVEPQILRPGSDSVFFETTQFPCDGRLVAMPGEHFRVTRKAGKF